MKTLPIFRPFLSILGTGTIFAVALASSLRAEDLPSVLAIKEPHDYSNTLQTRTEQIESFLGITSSNWRCHLPKGYRVLLQWWQANVDKPRWTSEFKTDELPQPDGFFFTLTSQSPVSIPAENKSPVKCEIGFDTPMGGMHTYYYFRGDRTISHGRGPAVGQEAELWSVSASIDGQPQKYFWMTMRIDKL